jgi:LysM repeat protein
VIRGTAKAVPVLPVVARFALRCGHMGSPRLIVIAALGAVPLLSLTGCGSAASGARQTIVPVQPSSYVVQEPVTAPPTTQAPPVTTPPAGGAISPTEQQYVIKAGDSLSKIAAAHEISMDDIINYNGWTDGTNHLLIPGETIRIPPNAMVPGSGTSTDPDAGAGGTTPPSGTTADTQPSGQGCSYTIEAGDNPSKVAEKYGITVDELRAANPAEVLDTFLVGATLVIPPNGDC